MSDKQYKLIRKQMRNIVQENLPGLLHQELLQGIQKDLTSRVDTRLENITKMVKETLDQLDQRSKDMQSYVVRNVGIPTAPTNTKTPIR